MRVPLLFKKVPVLLRALPNLFIVFIEANPLPIIVTPRNAPITGNIEATAEPTVGNIEAHHVASVIPPPNPPFCACWV